MESEDGHLGDVENKGGEPTEQDRFPIASLNPEGCCWVGGMMAARPAGRMAKRALVWADILAMTAAMLPELDLRRPRWSASETALMMVGLR